MKIRLLTTDYRLQLKKMLAVVSRQWTVDCITGFTLIELIIVISITTIIGLVLTDVLIQTLRAQNKIKILSQVKQNGQLVMERLTNLIRQGEKVLCLGDGYPDQDTMVVFRQGTYYRFRFESPKSGQNGKIEYDTFSADDFPEITSARCEDSTLIAANKFNVTDIDPVDGVSVNFAAEPNFTTRVFMKDNLAGYNDAVAIKFRAFSGVSSGGTYEVTLREGGVPFSTTVGLRGRR